MVKRSNWSNGLPWAVWLDDKEVVLNIDETPARPVPVRIMPKSNSILVFSKNLYPNSKTHKTTTKLKIIFNTKLKIPLNKKLKINYKL